MICLTFDTDWMSPEDMSRFVEMYPELPRSTFFIHDSSQTWRPEHHEWGPHPTIGIDELEAVLAGPPPSKGVHGIRSHSCVASHLLSIEWARQGFTYQSNETRLFSAGAAPFRTAWGIWEVPISYMDNMDMWYSENWPGSGHLPFSDEVISAALACEELYVFDFHPVHIAFNTRHPMDYARNRARQGSGSSAWGLGSPGAGTRTFFERVLGSILDAGAATQSAHEAVLREHRRLREA